MFQQLLTSSLVPCSLSPLECLHLMVLELNCNHKRCCYISFVSIIIIRFTVKEWRPEICGEEVFKRFGKENSVMNRTDFYAGDRFCLFIDLRSMRDDDLHGSGLRLVNTKEEVQLAINRRASGSGNVKCHNFILSDAQLNIINRKLESVTC